MGSWVRALAQACWCLPLVAYAQTEPVKPVQTPGSTGRAMWQLENDLWGYHKSDRNYTMGLSYMRTEPGGPQAWLPNRIAAGLAAFNAFTGIETHGIDAATPTFWTLSTAMYTPRDIASREPVRNDRPYASLVYVGAGYRDVTPSLITETELNVGMIGTKLGRWGQKTVHRLCCRDRMPQGWDNQIGDGGSPTFLYRARWSVPAYRHRSRDGGTTSVLLSTGAEVGYFTRALAGATLYYGATDADFDNVYLGAANGVVAPVLGAAGKGFSVWLDYEASYFAYNQLLQGAWFGRNPVRYSGGQIERVVHKVYLGVELTFLARRLGLWRDRDLRLYWTQSWRSKDLRDLPDTSQFWGGLMLSYPLK